MNTATTPVKFTTLHGPLYIAVMSADERSYHSMERGNVTELRPMVYVASDPTFEGDPAAEDHWTIRGRRYAIRREFFFEDRTHIEYAAGHQGGRWHFEHGRYRQGYFNDLGNPIERSAKTYDVIEDEVTRWLDSFDATHPGWKNLSSYLHYRRQAAKHESKAADLRREAAEQESKALKFAADAATCAGGIPEPILALIKKEN